MPGEVPEGTYMEEILTAFALHAAQHERTLVDAIKGLAGDEE